MRSLGRMGGGPKELRARQRPKKSRRSMTGSARDRFLASKLTGRRLSDLRVGSLATAFINVA